MQMPNMLDVFTLMREMPAEALAEWCRQYDVMSAALRERYPGAKGEARYQYEMLERERLRRRHFHAQSATSTTKEKT